MTDYLQLARDAYASSTSYFDTNFKKKIEYGIRAFQNEHAPGSKYLSEEYKGRSKIFRPKTRSIIRKNEAAANIALFSNQDVIVVGAEDPDNPYAVAGADLMKAVMNYRLNKTIPWFRVAMGALQDAQTVGACCSYNHWEYKQKTDKDGMRRVLKDQPCIKLRPIENLRFDGAADWLDPVGTSPYWIDIIPMYVCDVKAMMRTEDPKTGSKWKSYDDDVIKKASPEMIDTTRRLRSTGQVDPFEEDHPISDHDIVWVMKVFMREGNEDWCYYTLGNEELLTDPKPLEEVYFHGQRPYTFGCFIIETHKVLPDGVAQVTRSLQQETNEIANQRLDNVKLVLNKRWFVARGRQVDVGSLTRNVPGGVTLMNDPNLDVKESNWVDVTSSSYVEQDRLNADFDDLAGNFSASTKVANNAVNDTLGGSRMANQAASMMTEYGLRTWIETWVEPTLRQVMLLEQYYETNETVFALCGKKAQLWPKYRIGVVNDSLLEQELTLTVNVGQGATDPQARMQKFIGATTAAIGFVQQAPPGFNVQEAIKEVYSYAGFRDGTRFWNGQEDPRLAKSMQIIQQLQGQLQGKQMEIQANAQIEQMKAQSNERIKGAEIQVNAQRIQGDLQIRQAEIAVQQAELELEKLKLAVEVEGATQEQQMKYLEASAKIEEAKLKLEQGAQKIAQDAIKMQHEIQMQEREAMVTQSNEQRIGELSSGVSDAMKEVGKEIQNVRGEIEQAKQGKDEINSLKHALAEMARGIASVASNVQQMGAKPQVTGYKVQKGADGKRIGLMVTFDNGESRTLTEN